MRRFLVVPLVMLFTAGCLKTVTMRTVIEDDGSVDRLIRIESDEQGPPVASDLKLPAKEGWEVYKSEPKRFEARGKFKSVADIPLDYEKTVKQDEKTVFSETSKSVKTYRAFRSALFSVHEYRETITDITSADAFARAIENLADLRKMYFEVLEKTYGAEYDFSAAKEYAETEIFPRLRRLAPVYWDIRLAKTGKLAERIKEAAAPVLRELGTAFGPDKDAFGDFISKVAGKIAERIRPRDGGDVDVKRLTQVLRAVWDNRDEKAKKAAAEVYGKQFGTQEKFQEFVFGQGVRVIGAYLQFLSHGFQFEASVVMPGQIVEANGLIDGNEVSWSFTHDDVFPGYEMRARSVAFAPANQPKGGRAIVPSVKSALRLAAFAEDLPPEHREILLRAMDNCAKAGSAGPLRSVARDELKGLQPILKQLGLAEEEEK